MSPDNFALPEAYVQDGIFAPNRQAFKALIVRAHDSYTEFGVNKLYEYAQNGLLILFSGGIPTRYLGYNATGARIANETLQRIQSFDNVHVVPEDNLAATLQSFGVYPRASINANTTWYPLWREDSQANKDYLYVYNDAPNNTRGEGFSNGSITLAKNGQPYTYDQWTGDVSPIYNYNSNEENITIPITLAGNQTTVIGFHRDEAPRKVDAARLPLGSWVETVSNDTGRAAVRYPCDPAYEVTLANWTLVVESWTAPEDMYNLTPDATRTNTTYYLDELTSWRNTTDELRNVSGRGYYSASFDWSGSGFRVQFSGALLDLGAIVHTARARINGHQLPPLDVTRAVVDVGGFLRNGTNEVEILVSTPLGNALRPVWDEIQTSAKTPPGLSGVDAPLEADYGLVLPVVVRPYCTLEVPMLDA